MSAGFQGRTSGDQQIVGEVPIGSLPEAFSNMAWNLSARFGKLFVKIEVVDESLPPQEWRNCIYAFEGFRVNQQILEFLRPHGPMKGTRHATAEDGADG